MYESCLHKQEEMKKLFALCQNIEEKYEKIIELGRNQGKLDPQFRTSHNRVEGCQSIMYLHAALQDGFMHFAAESEALISQGLATLLIAVYSGEPPEVVLKCPPTYLDELEIASSLTPNRANGLYSLHLRMKQEALKALTQQHHSGSTG